MSQIRRIFAAVKRIVYILLSVFSMATSAMAQVETTPSAVDFNDTAEQELSEEVRPKLTHEILAEARRESENARVIDLPMGSNPLSRIDMAPSYAFHSPWGMGYHPGGIWSLHEGFNAEVGFSVTGSFGSNRIKGAGFGEHIAAAYAMPFGKNKRWMGALGVYADRLDWGGYSRTEAGVSGVLGYHVNDWCNLYVYGSYNFVPGRDNGPNPYAYSYACGPYGYPYGYGYMPYGYGYGYPYGYGMGYGCYAPYGCYYDPYGPYANLKGRIGAAAEFKIGESGHLTISVEHSVYESNNMMLPMAPPPAPEASNKAFGINDSPNYSGRGGNVRR